MIYNKICKYCGKEFTTSYKNVKYCCSECRNIVNSIGKSCKIYYHICENCGKEFITPQKICNFCSEKCTNEMDNLITLCSSCHRAIDTLNLEHAMSKCAKNAEKQLGIKHYTLDLRTSKEKVQDIQTDLLAIYKLLIGKIDDPDIEDIATQLNDIIDNIDNIKLNM